MGSISGGSGSWSPSTPSPLPSAEATSLLDGTENGGAGGRRGAGEALLSVSSSSESTSGDLRALWYRVRVRLRTRYACSSPLVLARAAPTAALGTGTGGTGASVCKRWRRDDWARYVGGGKARGAAVVSECREGVDVMRGRARVGEGGAAWDVGALGGAAATVAG